MISPAAAASAARKDNDNYTDGNSDHHSMPAAAAVATETQALNITSTISSSNNSEHPHRSATSPAAHGSKIPAATYRYCLCAALNSVNFGYDVGVSTAVAPKVQAAFDLTQGQLQLFVGCLNFWTIWGCALLSPVVSDRYGRRATFVVAAAGFIVGVLWQATASSYTQLMWGRTLVGLGCGIGEAVDPLYISELAPAEHRGELGSWAEIGIDVGVMLGFASSIVLYAVPDQLEWRLMLGFGSVLPVVMIYLCRYVLPESPRWLLTQQQDAAARAVLQETCPPGTDVDAMLQDMKESIDLERHGWSAICRPTPAIRRMLLVGIGVATMQQIVGIDAIMFYLLYMIQRSGVESELGQSASLIALGCVKMGFVFVGAKLLDTEGRRPLFLKSLFGCAASLLFVSFTITSDTTASKFLTVLALASYLAFFSLSIGPGAWVVVSEVFCTSIRAKAVSVALFPNRVTATVMASTFLSIANAITWQGFFWVLAVICLLCAAFVYFYVPETAGKSLEEMSHYFAELTNDRRILDLEARNRHFYSLGEVRELEEIR